MSAPIGDRGIYYAYEPCGCITGAATDMPGKADQRETAAWVAEWTREGRRVVFMPPSDTVLRPSKWYCDEHAESPK